MTLVELEEDLSALKNALKIYKDFSDLERIELKPKEYFNKVTKRHETESGETGSCTKGEDIFNNVTTLYRNIASMIEKFDEFQTQAFLGNDGIAYKEARDNFYAKIENIAKERNSENYEKNKNYLCVNSNLFTGQSEDYQQDYNEHRYAVMCATVNIYIDLISNEATSLYTIFELEDLTTFMQNNFLNEDSIIINCVDEYAFDVNYQYYLNTAKEDEKKKGELTNFTNACRNVLTAIMTTTQSCISVLRLLVLYFGKYNVYDNGENAKSNYENMKEDLKKRETTI